MGLFANLKPKFWHHVDVSHRPHRHLFNFRRIWEMTIALTLAVALIPLIIMAVIDQQVSRNAIESDILQRTVQLVSVSKQSVSYFLAERRAALRLVVRGHDLEELLDDARLGRVLDNLKESFGGFVDLGVIDDRGIQKSYAGPYQLKGRDYRSADWFQEVSRSGMYISPVFEGFRGVPHMVIAIRHAVPAGGAYVLRATLDTAKFNNLLSVLDLEGRGDAFVIDRAGVLQTPSRYHGNVLDQVKIPVPPYTPQPTVEEVQTPENGPLVIGYAYVPDTPFILMIVKHKTVLMTEWVRGRLTLLSFLVISVAAIILVVLGGITYLVNQIYMADQRRLMVLHQAEYANKMASLGRLSAGVAHEINNPLAIINEKAGLIRDLFVFRPEYGEDPKLMSLIDAIIAQVERCAGITRRLLNFARSSESDIKEVDLKELILEVLGFVGKEAEYRCIDVQVEVSEDVPRFESGPGRLQEIFLNLITNAFAAVEDGGWIRIQASRKGGNRVEIRFSDNGHGIPQKDLERVFEPFFSTRHGKGGTGLGLSITYGLVQELGGKLTVASEVGKGTTFTVTLPLVPPKAANKSAFVDRMARPGMDANDTTGEYTHADTARG